MAAFKPYYEGDTYYGPSAPDSGWNVTGLKTISGGEGRIGKESWGRLPDTTVLAWKRAPAPAPAAAPAPPPAPASQAEAQARLDASLAANQLAAVQVRANYAQQSGAMEATISSLESLLLKTKEDAAKTLKDQQSSFDGYMRESAATMNAMQSAYQSQLRAATATLPDPERTAVAPRLGDARSLTGRSAAANTLSQLRIIAPSLLGNGLGSVTLGGF